MPDFEIRLPAETDKRLSGIIEAASQAMILSQQSFAVAMSPPATIEQRHAAITAAFTALDLAAPLFDQYFDEMTVILQRFIAETGNDLSKNVSTLQNGRAMAHNGIAIERQKLQTFKNSLGLGNPTTGSA